MLLLQNDNSPFQRIDVVIYNQNLLITMQSAFNKYLDQEYISREILLFKFASLLSIPV